MHFDMEQPAVCLPCDTVLCCPHTHHEPLLDLLLYGAVELARDLPSGGTHPPGAASLLLLVLRVVLLLVLFLLMLLYNSF
jgi:hypothetical protein